MHQGALGDLILSLPALFSLREHHKNNPLTLAGNSELLALLQDSLGGKNIFSGHHKDWAGIFERPVRISSALSLFLNSFERAYLFAKVFPDQFIKGLNQAGLEQITWIPSFPDEPRGIPLQSLQKEVFQNQGIPWQEGATLLAVSRENLKKARELLNSLMGSEPTGSLWAIHPGSGSRHKNWPLERYIRIARELESTKALKPIFLLGPVEEEMNLGPLLRHQEFTVLSLLPLGILTGILSHCAGYLGNDSGGSHLAAALGLPTVALFGPTDPLLWGPTGPSVRIVSASKNCSPCSEESRRVCPEKACLSDITVEEVFEVIQAFHRGNF
jgi:ADP-heptose:LPS heptosyltransferase